MDLLYAKAVAMGEAIELVTPMPEERILLSR